MQPFKYTPKVNTGDLRNRVSVHANVPYENEIGELDYRFEELFTLWANVVPQTGKLQRQQADTILTKVTHKIVVRYTAGRRITKDMQIHFRGHRYEVLYVLNPYFRDETLEVFCQELMD